jgi:hypothetical protein
MTILRTTHLMTVLVLSRPAPRVKYGAWLAAVLDAFDDLTETECAGIVERAEQELRAIGDHTTADLLIREFALLLQHRVNGKSWLS